MLGYKNCGGYIVNSSMILLLALFVLILVSGFAWVLLRRMSLINDELRTITVRLHEMPKEISVRDYFYAQDRQLFDIREKLDAHPVTDELQQYIQDQANQIIAVISTHDEARKSGVTKADLEVSMQMTNQLLEKVLWSLRFDQDKYLEEIDRTDRDSTEKQGDEKTKIDTKNNKPRKDQGDDISMKSILNDSHDRYHAMLTYMQETGESGVEALQALESTR
jgi:hypothetical protein